MHKDSRIKLDEVYDLHISVYIFKGNATHKGYAPKIAEALDTLDSETKKLLESGDIAKRDGLVLYMSAKAAERYRGTTAAFPEGNPFGTTPSSAISRNGKGRTMAIEGKALQPSIAMMRAWCAREILYSSYLNMDYLGVRPNSEVLAPALFENLCVVNESTGLFDSAKQTLPRLRYFVNEPWRAESKKPFQLVQWWYDRSTDSNLGIRRFTLKKHAQGVERDFSPDSGNLAAIVSSVVKQYAAWQQDGCPPPQNVNVHQIKQILSVTRASDDVSDLHNKSHIC
jgi:hypothetical protein